MSQLNEEEQDSIKVPEEIHSSKIVFSKEDNINYSWGKLHNFIVLTFHREPDISGYGGGPTDKEFYLNQQQISYLIEYESQKCTKIILHSGQEIYVVESPQEIFSKINSN